MRDSYDDHGVTYIGPRALVVGFGLYCAGFLALVYGANWISESYEARQPVAGSVSAPIAPASTAPAAVLPARPAAQTPPRARAGVAKPICAPAPPCAVHPPKIKPGAKPAGVLPALPAPVRPNVRVAPPPPVQKPAAPVRASIRSAPAIPSGPLATVAPRAERREGPPLAVPERSAAPAARTSAVQAVRTSPARARQTPAALLVPFTGASGLTSSGGLDPRGGAHASPMVGPTKGLGPNPSATPFGGTEGPQQR